MKSKSDAENHKKSRLIAEKVYCRDLSRQMPNIAICRGKRQLSRFRTHRDKLLPLQPIGHDHPIPFSYKGGKRGLSVERILLIQSVIGN